MDGFHAMYNLPKAGQRGMMVHEFCKKEGNCVKYIFQFARITAFCLAGEALAAVLPALSTDLFGLPHAGVNYGFLALGQSVGSLLFPCIADFWGFEQGRHILAIAGAAAGFACIWAVTPVRREPQKKPN